MRHTFITVCLLLCLFVAAQPPLQLRFEHITTNNGLSNNTVTSIYQDQEGFIWFGTEDGLNRYDGSSMKTFRHRESDSSSLPGNNIFEIVADRYNSNKMWVSSHCWGLSNCNIYNGKCINFKENKKDSTKLWSNCEIGVLYDHEGNTWVKNNNTLSLFNRKNNTFKTMFREDSSLIYSFLLQGNLIWLGVGHGVKTYNIKTGEVKRLSLAKEVGKEFFIPRLLTSNGELVFGSWQLGLCIYNPTTQVKKYFLGNATVNMVCEISIHDRKQVWVASDKGLFVADMSNGYTSLTEQSFTCYLPNTDNPYSISSKDIKTIFQDNTGIIWLGTANNGIDKLDPNYLKFQQKQMVSSNQLWNQFANESPVDALVEMENGKTIYWFNYWYGGGLMKVDENFNVIDRLSFKHTLPDWQKQQRSLIVSKVFRYGKDTLCIASFDGLWLYNDKQKKLLRNYKLNDDDSTQPKKSKLTFAVKDKHGNVWIGTYNQQYHKLNISTGHCQHFTMGSAPNHTKYNGCSYMLLDNKERLWFSELAYYDFATKQFVHLKQQITVHCMLQDSKETVWAGSDLGLMRFDESTQTFKCYTVDDGLKSNRINNILEDNDGNIWATTPLGLVCFNPNTSAIKSFTTADGLQKNNTGSFFCKLINGNLMFQLNADDPNKKQPFLIFNPKELLLVNKQLPLHFTGINVMGCERAFEHSLDSLQQLDISYKENLFTIHFKALEFGNNFNIHYRYRLNNSAWTDLGSQDNITFTNLRGGSYLLQVQATDAAGNWMKKVLQMKLVVHPPFWQTWWFIGLMILLIVAISIYLVRRRIAVIKAKAQAQRQVAELEMKALKAQMNPHFVFNSLSSIQESIVHGKTEAAAKYLGKFSKLIRMVLQQSDAKDIALQDELDYLNLYLELESFRFENLVFSIDTNKVDDIAFIRIPSMIIQPYVENAIKHGLSHKQGEKKLAVKFEDVDNNMLQVTIEDNGIGRKQSAIINQNREASHVSMGMKITDERLQLLKERNAKVIIKDLHDEANSPTGTRVTLNIPIEK